MIELPDHAHAHAFHLPVCDVQYCLMILDELLMMSLNFYYNQGTDC